MTTVDQSPVPYVVVFRCARRSSRLARLLLGSVPRVLVERVKLRMVAQDPHPQPRGTWELMPDLRGCFHPRALRGTLLLSVESCATRPDPGTQP